MKKILIQIVAGLLTLQLGACAREFVGEDPPTDTLHFPLGLALGAEDRKLLVVSSNFDLAYNRGVVHAIDLEVVDKAIAKGEGKAKKAVKNAIRGSAFIPSFGGEVSFDPQFRHAFIANRAENTLIEMEVFGVGGELELKCGDRGSAPQDCTEGDHVVQLEGTDSFSVHALESGTEKARVYTGSLNGGMVSAIDADYQQSGGSRLKMPFVIESGLLRASGIVHVPAVGFGPDYLIIAGTMDGNTGWPAGAYLRTYAPSYGNTQVLGTVPLVGANQAADARAIALAPDNSFAYVVQRYPDSVAAVDLSLNDAGEPRLLNTAVQSVGLKPIALAVDSAATSGNQVLVLCFEDNSIYTLDGKTLNVLGILDDVGPGPSAIAIDSARGQAYVSLFNEDTVAVIALDRPDHHGLEVIARIGTARPLPEPGFEVDLDPFSLF